MKGQISIIALTFFLLTGTFAQTPLTNMQINDYQKKAKAIIAPFANDMKLTLKTSIKDNGIDGALEACKLKSPELINLTNQKLKLKDIEIGRTSHLLRNQSNAPKKWMMSMLTEFQKTSKILPARVVRLGKHRVGIAAPIYTKGLCLKCHGANINQKLLKKIHKKYPQDQAINFKMNQFRGLFWVEMPL